MEDLGITVSISADDADFDKKVSAVNKEITALKQSANRLKKELKLDPSNLDTMRKRAEELSKALQKAKVVYKAWNDMRDKQLAEGATVKELAETEKQIGKAHDRVLSLEIALGKANEQIQKATDKSVLFAEAMSKVSDFARTVAQVFEPISRVTGDFLKDATQGAIDFEDAFADVRKTVKSTGSVVLDDKMFSGLKDDVRELAKELPVTASEIAKIMGLAGQMNVPAEQLRDFTKAMIEFGDSTNINATDAVTEIAQIYNVIGKGGDFSDLDNLLSTIVELGNNSATTEKDIVSMFRNISAGASRVGMTEAQMVALSATLSSLGLDKGGASAISTIMTKIDMAVTDNGKKLQEWAKVAGMSSKEFMEAWSQDSANALLQIVSGMSAMTDEGISMNSVLGELDIKELRQIDTLSRLVNAHDEYAKNIELANRAYKRGTALQEEAQKRYETLASQIQILKNNFQEFALTLGEMLMPYIQWLIDGLMKLVEWLNSLNPIVKGAILIMTMVLAVIAPIAGWIATITAGIVALMVQWAIFSPMITSLFAHITAFMTGTFAKIVAFAMAHPILTAIVALIAIGVVLYNNVTEFRNEVILLWRRMKDLWQTFKETDWIEKLGSKFGWFGEILGWIIELITNIISLLGGAIGKVAEFLGLSSALGGVGAVARELATGNGWNVINSGGFGAMQSGGFQSGGITLNASFNVSSNNITRSDVRAWSEWLADDINEALGRRI